VKSIFASLALFLACATAHAATIALKNVGPTTGSYRWQCAATAFTDAGITGACMERHFGVCSGRGCVSKVEVVGTWLTTWDTNGYPTVDFTTPATWPGCQGTQSVVIVNGTPYYLIAADSLGDELIENYCVNYLVTP
jgi:hypothetical protein